MEMTRSVSTAFCKDAYCPLFLVAQNKTGNINMGSNNNSWFIHRMEYHAAMKKSGVDRYLMVLRNGHPLFLSVNQWIIKQYVILDHNHGKRHTYIYKRLEAHRLLLTMIYFAW